MEYYWLILNRSFVVFTYPEGLYGWKFSGPVSTLTPLFFLPFEEMARDSGLVPDSEDFRELMTERDSFFIPRDEIATVDYDPTSKWGMFPIQANCISVEVGQVTRADIARKSKRRGCARRRA
jgi:hypothetical protein